MSYGHPVLLEKGGRNNLEQGLNISTPESVRRSPVDEMTGIPLAIAPTVDVVSSNPEDINDHHHYFPRLSPELRVSLGGRALRVARIQRVGKEQHNFGENSFHKFYRQGPEVPNDPRAQLGSCVLLCSGFIPHQVIDTSSGEPVVRDMKGWEYDRLSRSASYSVPSPWEVKRFRDSRLPDRPLIVAKNELLNRRKHQSELSYHSLVYGYDAMRNFVVEQVLDQDYSDVRRSIINKFIDKKDIEAGLCLLAIGAQTAAELSVVRNERLIDVYKGIYSDGRLHERMPQEPATVIKNKLGTIEQRIGYLHRLRGEIIKQYFEDCVA